jgi:hypothetical protein
MKDDPEPNAAVELHDSTLERIEWHAGDVIAVLHAYVHRSSGRPGVDAGTGWVQPMRMRFTEGTATGSISAIPLDILDGRLVLSGETVDNMIPMPLSHIGPSRIELESWNDANVVIEGQGVTAMFAGPAEYVEEFEP